MCWSSCCRRLATLSRSSTISRVSSDQTSHRKRSLGCWNHQTHSWDQDQRHHSGLQNSRMISKFPGRLLIKINVPLRGNWRTRKVQNVSEPLCEVFQTPDGLHDALSGATKRPDYKPKLKNGKSMGSVRYSELIGRESEGVYGSHRKWRHYRHKSGIFVTFHAITFLNLHFQHIF